MQVWEIEFTSKSNGGVRYFQCMATDIRDAVAKFEDSYPQSEYDYVIIGARNNDA